MKKILILTLIPVMLLTLFTGCKGDKADKGVRITFNLEQEPKSMDPQIGTDHSAIEAAGSIWEGLTRLGKSGEVLPAVAEKWEVNGSTWTFYLRKNAKWSNGTAVTANDFRFAIKRAADPETAAEYAYMTYYIKNAQAFNEGTVTNFDDVGVRVVDDYTLEIELERPAAFFASVVAFMTYYPVNEEYYNTVGEEYALEADKMIFNGPWMMTEWEHESKMVMKKNPNYWNREAIKIDQIDYLMVADSNTGVNMYENGELDITVISGAQLPAYEGTNQLVSFNDGSVWYLEFNTTHEVFANKKVRKAMSLAIDRKTFVEKISQDGSTPALSYVPYGFPGKSKTFRQDYGDRLFEDNQVEEAKKLFQEGLDELGYTGKVSFSLLCGSHDRAVKYAQYVQAELNSKLGVEVTLEPNTFQIRLQKMTEKDFDVVFAGWGPDYNDPMTYMDLWVTNGGNNHTSWGDARYDELISTAQNTADTTVRMDAMAEAEKILIEEVPVGIIYFRNRNVVIKPHIKGVVKRAVGQETDFYWAYVDESAKK